jgi:vacuolar-type H+-ATPase subunit H
MSEKNAVAMELFLTVIAAEPNVALGKSGVFLERIRFMKAEIEKIIRADEVARKKVEAAKAEAETMRAKAQQEAKEIIAQKEMELETLKKEETEKRLSEARLKAQSILEETDRYLEKLRSRKDEQLDDLINDLLNRVTGF